MCEGVGVCGPGAAWKCGGPLPLTWLAPLTVWLRSHTVRSEPRWYRPASRPTSPARSAAAAPGIVPAEAPTPCLSPASCAAVSARPAAVREPVSGSRAARLAMWLSQRCVGFFSSSNSGFRVRLLLLKMVWILIPLPDAMAVVGIRAEGATTSALYSGTTLPVRGAVAGLPWMPGGMPRMRGMPLRSTGVVSGAEAVQRGPSRGGDAGCSNSRRTAPLMGRWDLYCSGARDDRTDCTAALFDSCIATLDSRVEPTPNASSPPGTTEDDAGARAGGAEAGLPVAGSRPAAPRLLARPRLGLCSCAFACSRRARRARCDGIRGGLGRSKLAEATR